MFDFGCPLYNRVSFKNVFRLLSANMTFFNRNFLSKTSLTFYSVAKPPLAWNMVGVLWMCSGCFRGFIFIFVVNSANFYKNLELKSPLTSSRSSHITSKNIRCYFIMGAMYKGMNNDEKRWIVPCRYWFHLSDKHIVYLSFYKRTNFWNASEGFTYWHTNCNMLTLRNTI